MLDFYQKLPEYINPIVLSVGFFDIRWYSIMYLVAFTIVYGLLMYRLKIGNSEINNLVISKKIIMNLFLYAIAGLLLGARLGYVVFYNPGYYFYHPLEIIWPFATSGDFIGFLGMSYYGGLIGVVISGLIFARKNKINFWKLADFVIPAIPAGYFFGRLGNFLNGELYGRITDKFWGMYFPADPGNLRHPSQLYEAFFEGLVLFLVLWLLRNRLRFPGYLFVLYLAGYGLLRFVVEFFREPDPQIRLIFSFLSLGQVFSVTVLFAAAYLSLRLVRISKSKYTGI